MKGALGRCAWWILPWSILWSALFLYTTSQNVKETSGNSNIELYLETFARAGDEAALVRERIDTNATAEHDTISTSIQTCFPFNSPTWLQGPRLGNIDDPSLTRKFDILPPAQSNAADSFRLQDLLDQSICSEGSRFRTMDNTTQITNETRASWTTRLIYWSMHYHQTRHAWTEARHRQGATRTGSTCSGIGTNIGHYDYECPNATFIVASLANVGLGANVRGGMVYGYLAGLVANRVVVWINDSPVGHKFLRRPWALVSCDNATTRSRRDVQCLFRPTTPCVLTHQDIEQAYALSGGETQRLLKYGQLPEGHEHDKVWYVKLGFTPLTATPVLAAERLQLYARYLIREHLVPTQQQQQQHLSQDMLNQAADAITMSDDPREGYNYGAANVKVHHALVVYAMRLRSDQARFVNEQLQDLMTRNKIVPEKSLGLPIRGMQCVSAAEIRERVN